MPDTLTFHLAACLYPGGLFDRSARPHTGGLHEPSNRPGPADQALHRLRARRRALHFATPVILAGDQVYVDATAGLFDPSLRDQPFKRSYDRLRAQPWRIEALMLTTPVTLMDDHEVSDNWEPSLNRGRAAAQQERMWMGRYEFLQRQRHGNPDPNNGPRARRSLWHLDDTTLPGRLLFVGDTRSERSARDPTDITAARIMGQSQMEALLRTVSAEPPWRRERLKFVATSSMLLPRRLHTAQARAQGLTPAARAAAALRSDAWCGYPGSLHRLLASLVQGGIQGCVFLSGDEHIPCVARATVQETDAAGAPMNRAITLWSVHAGALYAPFPFANARAADFAEAETFAFEVDQRHYRCEVEASFPGPGDGFVEVQVRPTARKTRDGLTESLALRFCSAAGEAFDQHWAAPAD